MNGVVNGGNVIGLLNSIFAATMPAKSIDNKRI